MVMTVENKNNLILFDSEKDTRFQVREITEDYLPEEFKIVAFDESYANAAQRKFRHHVYKVEGLSAPAANILKQTCLTVGAEAAVHRHAIDNKIPTDRAPLLISATDAQLDLILKKLRPQPFGLSACGEAITRLRQRQKSLKSTPQSMIIINCTPDSFSDGGEFSSIDTVLTHINEALTLGANWFDIGGESSRPGATPVNETEELKRVLPVIQEIKKTFPQAKLSIDTQKASVAEAAIKAGAEMVNDISGLQADAKMLDVVTQNAAHIVIMHMQGTPQTMQNNPYYGDVVGEIAQFFYQQISKLADKNYPLDKIILDPGFGFGKSRAHNLEILNRFSEFVSIGFPVMAGVSRKGFLVPEGQVISPENRDILTASAMTQCFHLGATYFRFHSPQLLPVMKLLNAEY